MREGLSTHPVEGVLVHILECQCRPTPSLELDSILHSVIAKFLIDPTVRWWHGNAFRLVGTCVGNIRANSGFVSWRIGDLELYFSCFEHLSRPMRGGGGGVGWGGGVGCVGVGVVGMWVGCGVGGVGVGVGCGGLVGVGVGVWGGVWMRCG